jgi:hypothetical protein
VSQPGPSKEYRDLLKKRITPDQYVEKVKKDVDRRLDEKRSSFGGYQQRRAASG